MDMGEVADSVAKTRARGPGQGQHWTLAETTIAFLFLTYLDPAKLGGTKHRADGTSTQVSAVHALAQALGRTDDSVVLKIMNLRSFATGGTRGMSGGSRLDARVVAEFASSLDSLQAAIATIAMSWPEIATILPLLELDGESERLSAAFDRTALGITEGSTERVANVAVRRGQGLFRARVLANFTSRCACCGLQSRSSVHNGVFLVAGHIRPWRVSTDHERLDPSNGISLCSLHDRAFEHGLMSLDERNRFVVSAAVSEWFGPAEVVDQAMSRFSGAPLLGMRQEFAGLSAQHLQFHRENVFESFLQAG